MERGMTGFGCVRAACRPGAGSLVVFRESLGVADVLDGFKDSEHSGEEILGNGFFEPFGPLADVVGIGASGHAGGDILMAAGELEGKLSDVDSLVLAEPGCLTGGGLDLLGFLQPLGEGSIGEQARGEGPRIHDSDAFVEEAREEAVCEGGVLEGVLVIGENAVELILGVVENGVEGFHRVTGESHRPDEPLLLQGERGRDCFLPDLWKCDEFNIVKQKDVEVIRAEAVKGNVDTFVDAPGGKIKVGQGVTAELGAEEVGLARNVAKCDAEKDLRHAPAVEGRGVDEVDAEVEGDPDGIEGLLEAHGAKLLPERGGPEGKNRQVETGVSEGTRFHGVSLDAQDEFWMQAGRLPKGPPSTGQLPESLDRLGGRGVRVGEGKDLRGEVTLVIDFTEGRENGGHFRMTKSNCLSIGVGKVHVSNLGAGRPEGLGKISLLDIHVEEVGEENGMIQTILCQVFGGGSELIELVGFVAIERLVDEDGPVAGGPFIGRPEGLGEPLQGLFAGDLPSPPALHGPEDCGCSQLSAEVDHGEDKGKSLPAPAGVRVGQGKPMLHHARPGSDCGDSQVVRGGHGFHLVQPDKVRPGKEKFDGVKAQFGGLGEALGKRLVEDEGPGLGFRHLGKSDCGLHNAAEGMGGCWMQVSQGISGGLRWFSTTRWRAVEKERNISLLNHHEPHRMGGISMRALGRIIAAILVPAGMAAADAAREFKDKIEPLLQDYCYDCHGDGAKKGDISLDEFKDLSSHLSNHDLWLRVWRNARTHLMPPVDEDFQPSPEERRFLTSWIEGNVLKLDPENPDPGRVTIRRLNREEYRNTIFDLVGVSYNVDDNFPPDDTGFGFDTIGDVLTVSPLLLEKYLMAAENIAELALPTTVVRRLPIMIDPGNFRERGNNQQSARFMEADKEHTVGVDRKFSKKGTYSLRVSYRIENERGRPKGQTARWRILLDGKELEEVEVSGARRSRGVFNGEVELSEGEHRFEFSIVPGKPGEGEGTWGVRVEDCRLVRKGGGDWESYPESYRRIFFKGLPPEGEAERESYMREIVETFATRAFRRPAEKTTVDRLTGMALSRTRNEGASFKDGVKLAVTAVLTSPRFLFRSEVQAEPDNPGKIVPVDEFSLASRLSYFLWSSAPDRELLELASRGQLRENLRSQVDRMLADRKADRMVRNFVGQWLQARDLRSLSIDVRLILGERNKRTAERIFDQEIRNDMKTETELFFQHIVRENRPVLELLNAKYSFLNEALANFYGVPGVKGREHRRVDFGKDLWARGGILTQGTFLIVTSQPTRTSPVKRGLFVLDNILGTPAPPAPPDVPELEEARKEVSDGTMRELMVAHREKALCKSCHERMDPIGLALENFNAIGQWRDEEAGKAIDSAGQLVTGEKFSNVMELKEILASSRKQDFYRCLTEKILTYALGRGVEYYDAPTVDAIVARLNGAEGRMLDLIYGVVESAPFQKRRGDGDRLQN